MSEIDASHAAALNKEASVAATVAAFAVGIFCAYFFYFIFVDRGQPGGPESWGAFGDFFGGIVNPVVGIATVILVVRTLNTTRMEAKETRQQLEEQTALLKAQVAHAERAQALAEIQKRLDGALADWDTQMDMPSPTLIRLRSTGEVVEERQSVSSRAILHDPMLTFELQSLSAVATAALVKQHWRDTFHAAIGILWELSEYCVEYDAMAGDTKLTDYYRRRVQLPLRAFGALGIVPETLSSKLRIDTVDAVFLAN